MADFYAELQLIMRAIVKTCDRHPDELASLFEDGRTRFDRLLAEAREVTVDDQAYMVGLVCEAGVLLGRSRGGDLCDELEMYLGHLD